MLRQSATEWGVGHLPETCSTECNANVQFSINNIYLYVYIMGQPPTPPFAETRISLKPGRNEQKTQILGFLREFARFGSFTRIC